ncbi:hypothetical protein CUMW_281790 [Citrus unshiu]|uniref:Uncharacterized protein n=1 Tax=Citrus unshiu TaxID=55188 RepID=A0A2H5MZX0_CITUN|nr:hypothetical protein CUMW_281790 [Citrus unshiu]
MGIRLPAMIHNAKQILKLHSKDQSGVPKGHVVVYVGELQKTRFVVPISYLNHPSFIDLLNRAEEEFGFIGWSNDSLQRRCLHQYHFQLNAAF